MEELKQKGKNYLNLWSILLIGLPAAIYLFIDIYQSFKPPYLLDLYRIYLSVDLSTANHYMELHLYFRSLLGLAVIPIGFYILIIYPKYIKNDQNDNMIKTLIFLMVMIFSLCITIVKFTIYILTGFMLGLLLFIYVMYHFKNQYEQTFKKWFKILLVIMIFINMIVTGLSAQTIYTKINEAKLPETITIEKESSISVDQTEKICELNEYSIYCFVNKRTILNNYYVDSVNFIFNEEQYNASIKNKEIVIEMSANIFDRVEYKISEVNHVEDKYIITIENIEDISTNEYFFVSYESFSFYIMDATTSERLINTVEDVQVTYRRK